jgi:hypothetical protein
MTCLHRERQFLVNGDYYREQIKLPGVYGLEIMGKGEKKVMVLVCVWQHGGTEGWRKKRAEEVQEEVEVQGCRDKCSQRAGSSNGGWQLVLGSQNSRINQLWLGQSWVLLASSGSGICHSVHVGKAGN